MACELLEALHGELVDTQNLLDPSTRKRSFTKQRADDLMHEERRLLIAIRAHGRTGHKGRACPESE
jgi:hypothetical protein